MSASTLHDKLLAVYGAIRTRLAAKYEKPAGGIPAAHLAEPVRAALGDARAPTAHKSSHATGGADALTPSDIGAASVADATLTPVYSQTPTFSEWTILRDGVDVTSQVQQPTYVKIVEGVYGWDCPVIAGDHSAGYAGINESDALSLAWSTTLDFQEASPTFAYTATRVRTDIGYQLGSQSTKLLQPKGDYVSVLESLTWAQLKAKRDTGALVPGASYRITDYVATTNGNESSRSAGHPFDLIVTADAANVLNEHARAIRHLGDAYFPAATKFEAWQVWYCIDNDTSRFAWAVADNATGVFDGAVPFTGGRGVIHRLVDEFSNDVPYDFKGLQFLAYGDSDNVYRYTFDSGDASGNSDCSLHLGNDVRQDCDNVIARNHHNSYVWRLNRIVFKGYGAQNNVFGPFCYGMTFGSICSGNEFGARCYENYFGRGCSNNRLGSYCHNNTFVRNCSEITLGNGCYSNSFCNGASSSSGSCNNVSLGDGCNGNNIGRFCQGISLGESSYSNTIGQYSTNIVLQGYSHTNSIGSYAADIVIGPGVWDIRFGHSTSSNGSTFFTKSYCRNITVESGNCRIYLDATGTTSSSQYYQNITIRHGTHMATPWFTIADPNVGQTFCTTYKPANSQEISI